MGNHINAAGQFQSDKYPDLAPDKLVLSFKDPAARDALAVYALATGDSELSADIFLRIQTIKHEG